MSVTEIFGENVFNLAAMRSRLPKETFKILVKTINDGSPLDESVAEVVANAMKDWAIEKGATHYTHWFQPMTGFTAEKHDSFIAPTDDSRAVMEFSGKELIKGEPDASSFPSGGIRATFEARGYTAWDPTSFAFVKDGTLCIPTVFCSYTGEVLDEKTPLLRSMEAVSKQAMRVLKFFNTDAARVVSYVGAEQEYFLVDKDLYKQRRDLVLSGRTLFGNMPSKGQELDDHYFGVIKERVSAYMKELDTELWKLGVYAKTKHNEVAPTQHELAPIFSTTNLSADHNQLTMELMKTIAEHHNMVCVLHEKPYEGINGSGKHNNWSIGTNTGTNLLKPGKDPIHNKRFLLFLSAVIKAVDEYGDLLRVSVASAGNDHRLGADEAPPAIVSMFLGEHLSAVLNAIKDGNDELSIVRETLETGVVSLPTINKDTSDRNRTSPFAFTGNKFEFRMPGAGQSVSGVNTVINTIVAQALSEFADRLEASSAPDAEIMNIVRDTLEKHDRVIFNGNNYSPDWIAEAERRGLPNLRTTVDALPALISEKSINLFTNHGVFSATELHSRYEILLEGYVKAINIEARTMLDMAKQEILPAAIEYTNDVAVSIANIEKIGLEVPNERDLAKRLSVLTENLIKYINRLNGVVENVPGGDDLTIATYYKEQALPVMDALRTAADSLENFVAKKYWPFPTYLDLLYKA